MQVNHVITSQYQGLTVNFTDEGWFNATAAANHFGRRVDKYLGNDETREYVAVLMEMSNTPKKGDLIRTRRGSAGGTWLHPDLAVHFARWLDLRFAVWCDRQIREILSRANPHVEWTRLRHEAAATYKVMGAILQYTRAAAGKACKSFHYMNEAKLVNWALVGRHAGLDRDSLSTGELDLLAKLEEYNSVLIATGMDYQDRKVELQKFGARLRTTHPALAA